MQKGRRPSVIFESDRHVDAANQRVNGWRNVKKIDL